MASAQRTRSHQKRKHLLVPHGGGHRQIEDGVIIARRHGQCEVQRRARRPTEVPGTPESDALIAARKSVSVETSNARSPSPNATPADRRSV